MILSTLDHQVGTVDPAMGPLVDADVEKGVWVGKIWRKASKKYKRCVYWGCFNKIVPAVTILPLSQVEFDMFNSTRCFASDL
jgi:hypothetical protein